MADRIKLLPDVVANQIAAGEVVNRPSSVVKEMMENAIDAGAHTVTVNARDGGRELIQIVDDGCGMSPMDARMAFDRHATSKIASVEDIYAVSAARRSLRSRPSHRSNCARGRRATRWVRRRRSTAASSRARSR